MQTNSNDLEEQKSYSVRKSNVLIRQPRKHLTLQEQRLIAFLVSKIKPTDNIYQEYTISISDYLKICGMTDAGKNYSAIKEQLKTLRDRSSWIKDGDSESLVSWLSKVRISPRSGKIAVKFDEDLAQHLIDLRHSFTSYEFLFTLPMRSNYSFTLYEILKSYVSVHTYREETETLKQMLCASHYTAFKDFKKRVLDVALREINKNTDLSVTFTTEKKGTRNTAVIFSIKTKSLTDRLAVYNRIDQIMHYRQMELADLE